MYPGIRRRCNEDPESNLWGFEQAMFLMPHAIRKGFFSPNSGQVYVGDIIVQHFAFDAGNGYFGPGDGYIKGFRLTFPLNGEDNFAACRTQDFF